jgi:hypothetical protein
LSGGRRPIVLAFLLLAVVTQGPFLRASLDPSPGTRFVGAFHWVDDLYVYASFIQQAESGRFLLENKLYPEPHARLYANLELWAAGRISALIGRRPFVAFRLLAVVALLAILLALDRLLREAGLPEDRRLVSLLLVALGGGTGGLLFVFGGRTPMEILDLSVGLFLHTGLFANPHWVVAHALALWMLLAGLRAADERGARLAFAALGTALLLVRPYDAATVAGLYGVVTLACDPWRSWPRRLLPLLWLLPAALYNAALLAFAPAYGSYLSNPYLEVPLASFAEPLGPAAAVVLLTRPWRGQDASRRRAHVALLAWSALAIVVPAASARGASLQLLVCVGTPLLALAALGLARLRAGLTALLLPLFLTTSAVACWIVLRQSPAFFVPAERQAAALALRPSCNKGGTVFAPSDIGLYAAGLTGCRAVVSHAIALDYEALLPEVGAFYAGMPKDARAALLERLCATHLVLPGDQGDEPAAWLGDGSRFRRVASVGPASRRIDLYARPPAPACPVRN